MLFSRPLAAIPRSITSLSIKRPTAICGAQSHFSAHLNSTSTRALYDVKTKKFEKKYGENWRSSLSPAEEARLARKEETHAEWIRHMEATHGEAWPDLKEKLLKQERIKEAEKQARIDAWPGSEARKRRHQEMVAAAAIRKQQRVQLHEERVAYAIARREAAQQPEEVARRIARREDLRKRQEANQAKRRLWIENREAREEANLKWLEGFKAEHGERWEDELEKLRELRRQRKASKAAMAQ